jgi:adenosine deaminase
MTDQSVAPELVAHEPLSAEYLRALPKAEVHCHLEGSVPPEVAGRLATKHGMPEADGLAGPYDFEDLESFLKYYVAISRSMRTSDDFEEVTYSSLMAAADGGLRYREIAFNPQNHPDLSYPSMVQGILRGARAAQEEAGIVSRVLVAINREYGGAAALDLIREVVDHRHDEVVGIGLDHNELVARPVEFVEAYDLARRNGLKLAAHTGERGDATEIAECLDLLKLDRIDHGYAVLLDADLLARTVASQIPFGSCWFVDYPPGLVEQRVIDVRAMTAAGLNLSLSSDDPGLFGSQLGDDFADAALRLGWTVTDAERFSLAGLDACFADAATLERLRAEFAAELERLRVLAHPRTAS